MPAAGPRVRDTQTRGCDGNTSGIVTPRDARFVASPTIPRGGGQPFFPAHPRTSVPVPAVPAVPHANKSRLLPLTFCK
jgi:hypothetical protein